MKIIKYQLCTDVNRGTEEEPQIEQMLSDVTLDWSAANEAIAKREAYNGEYTIIDDGETEIPTQLDRIEAQITYTALITDTLITED